MERWQKYIPYQYECVYNINRSLGGNNLVYENGKYYIQAGADTTSKKQLGSGTIKCVTLPNSTSIDIKSYTSEWAKLTNNNFKAVMSVGLNSYAYATLGEFTHNNGTRLNMSLNVYPSIVTSYNASTGILTVSVGNGSGGIQIVKGGIQQTMITITMTATIAGVYMYLNE